MPPAKIRVKLVSEAADYVSVTHVVQRDFSLSELVETMLPVLGKDAQRIRQILRAGTLDLPRESASRKPLFAQQSFWDGLLALAGGSVHYADYSHGDRADIFAL